MNCAKVKLGLRERKKVSFSDRKKKKLDFRFKSGSFEGKVIQITKIGSLVLKNSVLESRLVVVFRLESIEGIRQQVRDHWCRSWLQSEVSM